MADAESVGRTILARAGVTVGGDAPHDIAVHDERFYDRALSDRELGLGESYQEGWWDANELDEFLTVVQTADLRSLVKPNLGMARAALGARVRNQQSKRRAAANAQAHYDIGNDLYERMLDKRMIYSCGYWREATDLDTAQEAKLDLICRKLGLERGMRLLDIGCGWGGFAQFAAERYDVHVTGISPAREQVAVARERTASLPVHIEQIDYRDVDGRYDRITSIGMMEHVGPKNLGTLFAKCRELLDPDGMMLHHTIGSNDWKTVGDPWFDKYIFPGGVLPSLGQIARAAEEHWSIEDVHNFGPDYDTTLMEWHRNISGRWHEIPHYDERFRRTWDYYLLGSAAGFRSRSAQLFQIVFTPARQRRDVYRAIR
ncbi:MAG: cyclopropane-fatty-acyl-phospholipid synthase [Acidimicrobiales bacterium]|nr:MAG: cyclopropane-fatty-acyl-phospholipid synthase [Acidimicrobiales bacterium]